jgi:hypothetical protein
VGNRKGLPLLFEKIQPNLQKLHQKPLPPDKYRIFSDLSYQKGLIASEASAAMVETLSFLKAPRSRDERAIWPGLGLN